MVGSRSVRGRVVGFGNGWAGRSRLVFRAWKVGGVVGAKREFLAADNRCIGFVSRSVGALSRRVDVRYMYTWLATARAPLRCSCFCDVAAKIYHCPKETTARVFSGGDADLTCIALVIRLVHLLDVSLSDK